MEVTEFGGAVDICHEIDDLILGTDDWLAVKFPQWSGNDRNWIVLSAKCVEIRAAY